MSLPVLQIVIGSTRPGRAGLPIARWIEQVAVAHGGFEVELVDLVTADLPLLDEPSHPRLAQYTHQHSKDWSATIARGDAYIFVMPEYNFGINAALKNAVDYLFNEWRHKPVALVSYGGVSAGLRAAQMMRQVLAAFSMTILTEAVTIPVFSQFIDDEGQFVPNEMLEQSAGAMLTELARYAPVLRELRAPTA